MEIVRAHDMGFCYGVRRAVDMMESAASERGEIATLGSIVHNPLVTERLAENGIAIVSTLEAAGERPIAITAHGVGPDVVEAIERQGLSVIDTTCPIVTRAQQWARKLNEEGYAVIVFGDPNHKEVRGILSWAGGRAIAVEDERGIERLPENLPSRVAVLVQTTHTEARFASFIRHLFETRMDRISELRVVNTLCNATTSQQAAAEELAREVDVIIVVGGRESANTRHLAEICSELGTPAHHIERADEIDPEWLAGVSRVGLTAGASTPDFSIDAVEDRLRELQAEAEASGTRQA
ncbi:MAG TPA: 4-hydroxy-3-methylbut-2-enyl diphosphate reductase [Dehalococcoidia bacterium]|nr:4-hydroxy-3-methylbut-2-enyl diphosphate reductase [Dehalococcoidia bacterium]